MTKTNQARVENQRGCPPRAACPVWFAVLILLLGSFGPVAGAPTNSLVWHRSEDRVDADLHGEPLLPLLEQIARQAGWRVFVEPDILDHRSAAKFKNLPVPEALRMLLGDLNFLLTPPTNGVRQLYVFHTVAQNATRAVLAARAPPRHVPNEILVRVKPGTDIEALARSLGAKITGRNDKLGLYRLLFDNAAAADAALAQLQKNSDVLAADYDYYLDPPPQPQLVTASALPPGAGPVSLNLNPPKDGDPCSPVVGMIDTTIQPPLLGNLSPFLLPAVSVTGETATNGDPVPTHGTAMAETILRAVAQASGGSSSVRILPVDVYGGSATTTSWNVALGIQAAVDHGATVLNLSLGGAGDSSVLASVVQQAVANGIVIFAAAGNTPVAAPTYPAAYPGVNDVTALSAPGQLAPYANFSPQVNLALPGASVVYAGSQAYLVQGTSPATAYASGLAAGTKNANCLGWEQILATLQKQFPVPSK